MNSPVTNEEEFARRLASGGDLVALFYSAWCPFCTGFLPVFGKYAAPRPRNFLRVLTNAMPSVEDRYSIEVVPSLILFSGGKAVRRLDGLLGQGITEAMLKDFLKDCGF